MSYKDRDKQRAYQREWQKKRRLDWLRGKSCAHCGSTERLEVDHIDPSKKKTHRVWSFTKAKRDAELAKCQALCHKCHVKKTAEGNRRPMIHGTRGAYRKGCRCDLCRQAQTEYRRRYRAGERPGSVLVTPDGKVSFR